MVFEEEREGCARSPVLGVLMGLRGRRRVALGPNFLWNPFRVFRRLDFLGSSQNRRWKARREWRDAPQ